MSAHLIFDLEELHERCDEVNPLDAEKTIVDLTAKLKKYKELYALSAPQIGVKERVICIKYNNDVIKEYVNPVVLKSSNFHYTRERDVTIPETEFISLRPNEILIRYQTKTAKPEENILKGSVAEVFDRMMNYLDGVTLDENSLPIDPEWNFDELNEKDQLELINYLFPLFIKHRSEKANNDVQNDPDAKELQEAIEFMKAVDEGKVKFDRSCKKERK